MPGIGSWGWMFWVAWIQMSLLNPLFWIVVILFMFLYYRQKRRYEKLLKLKEVYMR